MSPGEYVEKFKNFIKTCLKGSALLPSVVMAHALYEAADDENSVGKNVLSSSYNNDLRIRADRTWNGPKVQLPNRRYSKRQRKLAWFRVYASPELSIADRIKMLTKKITTWPTRFWYKDTLQLQATTLRLTGVSGDPTYEKRIIRIINQHKLYWLDRRWLIESAFQIVITLGLLKLLALALVHWDKWVPWR